MIAHVFGWAECKGDEDYHRRNQRIAQRVRRHVREGKRLTQGLDHKDRSLLREYAFFFARTAFFWNPPQGKLSETARAVLATQREEANQFTASIAGLQDKLARLAVVEAKIRKRPTRK